MKRQERSSQHAVLHGCQSNRPARQSVGAPKVFQLVKSGTPVSHFPQRKKHASDAALFTATSPHSSVDFLQKC